MPDAYQVPANFGYGMSLQQTPQQIQTRALAVLRAFTPKKVVGFEKVRLGRDSDGGYIHVDDFSGVEAVLSFGISDDVSWDLDIARRNIPIHQFDHTIEKPPADNPMFFFHKARVAASDEPGAMSLDSIVGRFLAGCNRAILKIDIEGDEWAVLHAVPTTTLARFSQIVCEFHGLQLTGGSKLV